MWDEQWKNPTASINGGSPQTMGKVSTGDAYDMGLREIREYYMKTGFEKDYTWPAASLFTLFSVYAGNVSGTAVISVQDRFGNTYKTEINL